jgi:4-hydroxythreonine-4-phosphate dehydrogenase
VKPRIVITSGDPAGIGPEIVAAAVRDPKILAICDPVVVGDPVAFTRLQPTLPKVEMLPVPGLSKKFAVGVPSKEAGYSALEALRAGTGLVMTRQAHALVTAPISKESLALADAGVPGHTEWLAKHTQSPAVAMLMVAGKLRAVLMTRHVPIRDVSKALTSRVVEESGALGFRFVKEVLGKKKPRLVACGLNPHAGDHGLLGHEEAKVIEPALARLRKNGVAIDGPRPADTAFREMADGEYDLALAAYHDQAMIPLKLYAAGRLVNITLGLPFIRTSPGHGTAYDIAGKGEASADSLKEAIGLAARYACANL